LIFHQHSFQHHPVKKGKLYIPDADTAMQVFGKLTGNLRYQPVLHGTRLNEQP
jgi:hypothetical protein